MSEPDAPVTGVDNLDPSTAPTVVYQQMLGQGALGYQRCEACEQVVFYPRVLCTACGSDALTWHASQGRGSVYSTTTVRVRNGDDYNVSLVDLDEGFRMMTNVVDLAPSEVSIGQRVQVVFRAQDDGVVLPQFVVEELS
jgi:uncharacterized OB-fold protein